MDNQTEERWLIDGSSNEPGTGVFVYPEAHAYEFGPAVTNSVTSQVHGALQKAFVPNLNYLDCVERGEKDWVLGYKWVPETVAPFATVQAGGGGCAPVRCVKRCARYGCICIAGECK